MSSFYSNVERQTLVTLSSHKFLTYCFFISFWFLTVIVLINVVTAVVLDDFQLYFQQESDDREAWKERILQVLLEKYPHLSSDMWKIERRQRTALMLLDRMNRDKEKIHEMREQLETRRATMFTIAQARSKSRRDSWLPRNSGFDSEESENV